MQKNALALLDSYGQECVGVAQCYLPKCILSKAAILIQARLQTRNYTLLTFRQDQSMQSTCSPVYYTCATHLGFDTHVHPCMYIHVQVLYMCAVDIWVVPMTC